MQSVQVTGPGASAARSGWEVSDRQVGECEAVAVADTPDGDSRRSRLSRTKIWESMRSRGSLVWQRKQFAASTARTVSTSCSALHAQVWPTRLDDFAEHLRERFNDGHTFALRRTSNTGISRQLRNGPRLSEASAHTGAAPDRRQIPKVRRITSWILRHRRQPHRRRAGRTGRSSSATGTSKQPQGMSLRSRRCSPNALVHN